MQNTTWLQLLAKRNYQESATFGYIKKAAGGDPDQEFMHKAISFLRNCDEWEPTAKGGDA